MINDHIFLTQDDAEMFADVCSQVIGMLPLSDETEVVRRSIAPADIITANTVPLKDVVLRFKKLRYEITTTDAYTIRMIDDTGVNPTITADILYAEGENVLYVDPSAEIYGRKPTHEELETHKGLFKTVNQQLNSVLRTWYGIQICLLNPYVKNVFRTEGKKETHFNPNGKKRKYQVCYVRHHYLITEAKNSLRPTAEGGMLRHTLAWYVCGHWRHYQDGKVIFVQPYWKGPLRKTKQGEPRERVVV